MVLAPLLIRLDDGGGARCRKILNATHIKQIHVSLAARVCARALAWFVSVRAQ